ncbi:MAG: peptide deformylase [Candidatus Midichloriaceae bacterium]|jgi:peptide deformylase
MALLKLIYGLDPIFRKKAEDVKNIDQDIKDLAQNMFETMKHENAIGCAGNMFGILKRIIVINLDGSEQKYFMINPKIVKKSMETSVEIEGAICFPGINVEVERYSSIIVEYINEVGEEKKIDANGVFARVIQHEIDYLDGIIHLDYVSKLKQELLIKKMGKYMKRNGIR